MAIAHGYYLPTMTDSDVPARNDELRDALKRAASALKAQGPEFALAGSYALWVHGGPEPVHDVDFVVAEEDADTAAKTLEEAGFRIDRPPEDWLFKACTGDVVVDVLHRLNGVPVDPATIRGAEELEVLAIAMPVLPPTHVVDREAVVAQRASLRFRGPAAWRARRPRAGELGPASVPTPPTTISPRRSCSSPTASGSRPNPPPGAAARRASPPPEPLRAAPAPRIRTPAAPDRTPCARDRRLRQSRCTRRDRRPRW